MHDCPTQRALIIRADGEYSSASDVEDSAHALFGTNTADQKEEICTAAASA